MNYPGDDLKFRITAEIPDFQLSEDVFRIVVRDRYMRTVADIAKEDCFYDDQGHWYFTLEKVRRGWYYAYFTALREDEDFDGQQAACNDAQLLCAVGCCAPAAGCRCRHKVHYEQVWSVSVDGADYLADCDGRYVLTSDGKRIQFTNATSEYVEDMGKVKMQMTGEEFLKLMEDRNPNGQVDTIPEMMDAMRGISDDKTLIEEIDEQVDEDTPERVTQEDLDNFVI